MNRLFTLITLILAAVFSASAVEKVYVLNLDDDIGSETWHYTRQALKEAREIDSDMLIVHLNTYGGSVVHADSIRTSLLNFPKPVVAFVDNNAASAGALIALACDTVFMRPGGTMGAVTVVNGADGMAMPDKYQSYMRAMMRSTAEHHGKVSDADGNMQWRRDPLVAEAMVDPRIEVPGLIDSTKVLTFTADEAIRWKYAEDKAESLYDVLKKLDVKEFKISSYNPTWVDRLIGFFTSPAVQALLIAIIIGGIYMEMHTPGVGFAAAASITAAILYFLPLYITGIASGWIVLLFVGGLILIVMEIFVVPGFGVTGIAGIICVCTSLILGLLEHFSFSLGHVDTSALWDTVLIFLSGLTLTIAAVWYLTSSHGPKWARRHTELLLTQQVKDGYIGVDMEPLRYIGLEGTAVTDLRPSGKVEVDGDIVDTIALMGFVSAGEKVRVIKYENAQIYVKRI